MKTRDLAIEGMACRSCVMSVRNELSRLPAVTVEDVQIGKARVHYDELKVTDRQLAEAVEQAGYRLVQ